MQCKFKELWNLIQSKRATIQGLRILLLLEPTGLLYRFLAPSGYLPIYQAQVSSYISHDAGLACEDPDDGI